MEDVKVEVKDEVEYDIMDFKTERFDDELTLSDCSGSVIAVDDDIDDVWKTAEGEIRNPDLEIDLGEFKPFFCEWEGRCSGRPVQDVEQSESPGEEAAGEDGQRPYKCTFCQMSFTRKCGLTSHQRIAHVDVEKRLEKYNGHRIRMDQIAQVDDDKTKTGRVKCSLCSRSFANEKLLKRHWRFHSACSIRVGSRSADPLDFGEFEHDTVEHVFEQLNRDAVEHDDPAPSRKHEKTQCPLCKRIFHVDSLRRHSVSHAHEKPFRCENCKVEFISITYFFKHLHATPGSCDFKTVRPAVPAGRETC